MDEVIIVAIIFGSILAALKLFFDYRRDRNQTKTSASPEPSLTTSELKKMLGEVVDEALDRRLGAMEQRLEERERFKLMPASSSAGQEIAEDDHPGAPLVKGDRSATR